MILDFSKNTVENFEGLPWEKDILAFLEDFKNPKTDFVWVQSSGSTGEAKKIKAKKSAMLVSAKMTLDFFGLEKQDKALLVLPIQYIAGKMMLVRAIVGELKLYCIEPKTQLQLEESFDFAAMTPMQAENSMTLVEKCKNLILGGTAVNQNLEEKLKNIPSNVYESYGMTETLTHIALRKIGDENFFCTLPGVQIELDDRGCLCIKTPFLDEKITTNDLATLIAENQFALNGRIDFVINSGGVKIQTEKVEEKLMPYIQTAFVYSYLEDEKLEQKPILIIEGKNRMLEIPDEVFGVFEKPKEIYFLEKFVRSGNQKILREKTRAELKKSLKIV